jgi:hypothetical protein
MFRALSPFGKSTTTAKLRGMAALMGLTVLSTMVIGMLRAAGDDDKDGINTYDSKDLGTVTRSIVIPLGNGEVAKAPVGFGYSNIAWSFGNVIDRFSRGQITGAEAGFSALLSFMRQTLPDTTPSYMPTEDPLTYLFQVMSPTALRPLTDVVANKTYWGSKINQGNNKVGVRPFEEGTINTNPVWHSIARAVYNFTGGIINLTPETYRYLGTNYAFGPFQGIIAAMESSPLYEPEFESTRRALGPWLTALGAGIHWSAAFNEKQTYYYDVERAVNKALTARGAKISSTDNKTSEDRIAFTQKVMREHGFSQDEINAALALHTIDSELDKVNKALRAKYAHTRFGDITEPGLKADFEQSFKAKEALFNQFLQAIGPNFHITSEYNE